MWLHSFPSTRIEDFHVQTTLDEDYEHAELSLEAKLNKAGVLDAKLLDEDGKVIFSDVYTSEKSSFKCTKHIKSPHKWTAETPYLYTLVLSVSGVHVAQKVGFRVAELIHGVFCVNGQPAKIRGVNRHEHHP